MRQKIFKRLCLLFCVLTSFIGARAETLTVCDGTTTSEYAPLYGYYYDTRYSGAMVYPASMISDMESGTINSIKFYANSSFTFNGGAIKVSMGEVESATLTALPTGLAEYFTGTPTSGSNEYEITLNTPYEYAGGNLVIQVELTSKGSNYQIREKILLDMRNLGYYKEDVEPFIEDVDESSSLEKDYNKIYNSLKNKEKDLNKLEYKIKSKLHQ